MMLFHQPKDVVYVGAEVYNCSICHHLTDISKVYTCECTRFSQTNGKKVITRKISYHVPPNRVAVNQSTSISVLQHTYCVDTP